MTKSPRDPQNPSDGHRPRGAASGFVSWAARWAMRPQTAMAAVFLLMLGSSALLLRSRRPKAPEGKTLTVTEQGTPAPPTEATDSASEAEANSQAALSAARGLRDRTGCGGAVSKYDQVSDQWPETRSGHDAMLEAGHCYMQLGSPEIAKSRWSKLLNVAGYAARAQNEINALNADKGALSKTSPHPTE